eukprot:Em0018g539a
MASYVFSFASSGFSSILHSNDRISSFINSAHSKVGDILGVGGKINCNVCCTGKIVFSDEDCVRKIPDQNVALEDLVQSSTMHGLVLSGSIQVSNLAYQKEVFVRLTRDSWRTYYDIAAQHQQTLNSGKMDRFVFASCVAMDDVVEFAICYGVNGTMFWDNNRGSNYCFDMCATL